MDEVKITIEGNACDILLRMFHQAAFFVGLETREGQKILDIHDKIRFQYHNQKRMNAYDEQHK